MNFLKFDFYKRTCAFLWFQGFNWGSVILIFRGLTCLFPDSLEGDGGIWELCDSNLLLNIYFFEVWVAPAPLWLIRFIAVVLRELLGKSFVLCCVDAKWKSSSCCLQVFPFFSQSEAVPHSGSLPCPHVISPLCYAIFLLIFVWNRGSLELEDCRSLISSTISVWVCLSWVKNELLSLDRDVHRVACLYQVHILLKFAWKEGSFRPLLCLLGLFEIIQKVWSLGSSIRTETRETNTSFLRN